MAALSVLLLLACLLTSTLALIATPNEKTCPDEDYLENGICCNKCSPGFKLVAKCLAERMRSNCTPCPTGQFMEQMNYSPKCMQCKSCNKRKHEVEVSKCQRDRNTRCHCEDGYYTSVIDSETTECIKCKLCTSDEREVQKCTTERNTVCECKANFFRVNRKCEPCKSCAADCKHLCKSLPSHKASENGYLVHALTGAVVVAVTLLMLLILYMATKRLIKKSPLKSSSQTVEASPESSEALFKNEEVSIIAVTECPESTLLGKANSKLPDCVPLEIKTHDLIYTLLDSVPVTEVKELARYLGVNDSVIARAELDHRSSKEAHYQMLKAWAESGSQASGGGGGGRGRMLHSALLQELLLVLKHMHLGAVAEELETKYSIH